MVVLTFDYEEIETPEYDKIFKDMMTEAKQRHGENIGPPGGKKSWDRCLTVFFGKLYLWYNDFENDGTHVITRALKQ